MASAVSIARWLLSEAASGTSPTTAYDDENSNDLTISFNGGGNWASDGNGNGLDFTASPAISSGPKAELADISGNGNIGSSLGASCTEISAIIVADNLYDGGDISNAPRLFFIGSNSGNGDFAVTLLDAGAIEVRWAGESESNYTDQYSGIVSDNNTHTLAIVVDSSAAAGSRSNVYLDGSPTALTPASTAILGVSVDFDDTSYSVVLGNRPSENRNVQAGIYYVELFTGQLTTGEVGDSHTELSTNHDANWAAAAGTIDQYDFRFELDDGTESASTFAAAEGTAWDGPDVGDSFRLRVGLDATGDPASTTYVLQAQQNGAGGYVTVPVGATTAGVAGPIEAGDITNSGNNTASATWSFSHPVCSTGDLLIWCIQLDDAAGVVTSVTPPSGQNSETLTQIGNLVKGTTNGTNVENRVVCFYTITTSSWTAASLTFTPAATEQGICTVVRVPSGEFDATTPIGANAEKDSASTTTTLAGPTVNAGASDGGGILVCVNGCDQTAINGTVPTGYTQISQQDVGAPSGQVCVRDAAVTDSETISGATFTAAGTAEWAMQHFIVRPPADVTNELYIFNSAESITHNDATTERIVTDGSGSFLAGHYYDTANGAAFDITDGNFTELVWNMKTQSPAADNDYWDFRVAGMTNYDLTPRVTIDTGAGPASWPRGKIFSRPFTGPFGGPI